MKRARATLSDWWLSTLVLILSLAVAPAQAAANDGQWAGPLAGVAPPSRYAQAAIYDPVRDRMVMFGGIGTAGLLNDVWSLSLAGTPTWTEIAPGHGPSARYYATAVYDPVRDRMLVFGGWDRQGRPQNDLWALNLAGSPSWDAININGTKPEARYQHTAIYDPVRDRMIVLGGAVVASSNTYYEEDVWELDLAGSPAWHELAPAPSSHWLHTAVYDPVRDRMVVFGGYSDSGDPTLAYETDQTWEMSFAGGGVWTQLAPMPDPITMSRPNHRGGHVAVYDPSGDGMLMFGGIQHYPFSYLSDLWSLSLGNNPTWRHLAPGGPVPDPRYNCSAVVRGGDRVVVYGGEYLSGVRNDTWTLSLAQPVSTPLELDLPARFDLAPPRPNPSRGEAVLGFELARPARVILDVFDSQGRHVTRVADGWLPAGRHAVTWRGDDQRGHVVGSGVYYVQMQAGAFRALRPIVRIR